MTSHPAWWLTCHSARGDEPNAYVRIRFVGAATVGAPRRRLGVDAAHEHYKWWALSCTSLGMLLATINSGTLIIALPDLERALGTSILSLVWVILAYMIASTVLVLTAGRLSDLFGRKRPTSAAFSSSRSPRSAPASPRTGPS